MVFYYTTPDCIKNNIKPSIMQQPDYMAQCPNCKQFTIPASDQDGLLSDWCDSCDTSIFDDSDFHNYLLDPDYAAQQLEDNREL